MSEEKTKTTLKKFPWGLKINVKKIDFFFFS